MRVTDVQLHWRQPWFHLDDLNRPLLIIAMEDMPHWLSGKNHASRSPLVVPSVGFDLQLHEVVTLGTYAFEETYNMHPRNAYQKKPLKIQYLRPYDKMTASQCHFCRRSSTWIFNKNAQCYQINIASIATSLIYSALLWISDIFDKAS